MVTSRPPRRLADWALALLAGDELPPVRAEDRAALVSLLTRHGLAPYAHVRTREPAPDLSTDLRPQFEGAVGQHLRTRAVIGQLTTFFDGSDTAWLVLKGPVLSETAHPVLCARPYLDLDVLVPPTALREVVEGLRRQAWTMLDRDEPLLLARRPGEVHLLSPTGVQLDLHWSLFNMERTRLAFPHLVDELLSDRRYVRLGEHQTPTLGREQFLVHVCLHAALSGADRLLHLLDIDQLVATDPPDWDRVIETARRWGAGPACAVVLGRARRLLGTVVADSVQRRLAGTRWRTLAALVDRVSPVHRGGTSGSLSRIVARASRPNDQESWMELRRRVLVRFSDTVVDRSSLGEPRSDGAAFDAYVAAVVAEAQRRASSASPQ